ncbi:MAG: (2Fe-2S) ferredoxin domain-containing protein [Magnetovibrionaceae bacterium]
MTDQEPFYRAHVFFCMNERPDDHPRGSCACKGSVKIRNYLKARAKELGLKGVRINQSGCLDRCELGPVAVIYPEGVWYKIETLEQAEAVLTGHLRDGKPVEELMLSNDDS